MSHENWSDTYPAFVGGELASLKLLSIFRRRKETEPQSSIWSARLSTGLFGFPDCPSGNKEGVPKGGNQVLLAFGDAGLIKLIDLGFIPCIKCHPERSPAFWEKVNEAVTRNYPNLIHPYQFANKTSLPFDARRIKWETLAPYLKSLPNRLYLPPGLEKNELDAFRGRMKILDFELPKIGFLDRSSPKGFTEYRSET